MHANSPLRSHAFVAIATLGAAAAVGWTTAEAAPIRVFQSRPAIVGLPRFGPAFAPRPAAPMLGNRFSSRFSPVTRGPLVTTTNNSSRNFSIVNSQRRATPIAHIDRGTLNNNSGKNNTVNLQRREAPIAHIDRGALNNNGGNNSIVNLQRREMPIAHIDRGAIPQVGAKPHGPPPSTGTGQAPPAQSEDQGGSKAQIEQALLDLLRSALDGQGQANQGQSGQGTGQGQASQGQASQGQAGQGTGQGQADRGQAGLGAKSWSKVPEKVYAPVRVPSSVAARSVSRRVAEPATPSCLTKEYLETSVVLFRDVCTKEWAINSTSVASQVVSAAGRSCLIKQYLQADVVLFKDTCTNEWAMNPPEQQAQAPKAFETQ
jgi:hypothetical protein